MSSESEPLESYYASGTLGGLIRSGFTLLQARRVRSRAEERRRRLSFGALYELLVYVGLIVVPAVILDTFQRLRTAITRQPRGFPHGAWQFYLSFGLREDLAHFTNETVGYHLNRPTDAVELDDLTAWVMTVIQFLWNYDELMGIVWDEWVMLRLVGEAAQKAELAYDDLFVRLQRRWEVQRPYTAPLNGTYADVRRAVFETFISQRLAALPEDLRAWVHDEHARLAATQRSVFIRQMSLRAHLIPGRHLDAKGSISPWDACIGLIVGGEYHLINVVDHNEKGTPIVYEYSGTHWPLSIAGERLFAPDGTELELRGGNLHRAEDGEMVGYLDMAPVSRIKWQLRSILERHSAHHRPSSEVSLDTLLAETPRHLQRHLRSLLPARTQQALHQLACAPIIINWDERLRDSSLAELRRAQRGVGDHPLTIMRTESSIIFDQSHVFFDGTWSLAMAEVLTSAAVQWCRRCISIAPSEGRAVRQLDLVPSSSFLDEAYAVRQVPEISAETIIWDISNVLDLRQLLGRTGTRLTINDLLIITRIFHAAHYRPSPTVQAQIDGFVAAAATPIERRAVEAIERSLQRGRVLNPALLIPVDASPVAPRERIFPITFRNLADNLVWIWDDTWDAYQAYRRIEPPDTPEGIAAFQAFVRKRSLLVGNLRAFSYILAANKAVAMRGASLNIAILELLVGLPPWLQVALKGIPEQFPFLNELLRGDEVYSNVGRVAAGSTLSRFMTAKDDGNTKALAWGIMTDDENRLNVTMRDFRPHVKPLIRAGAIDLARQMAQDYVQTYTYDLMGLVARLTAMLQVQPPTQS